MNILNPITNNSQCIVQNDCMKSKCRIGMVRLVVDSKDSVSDCMIQRYVARSMRVS